MEKKKVTLLNETINTEANVGHVETMKRIDVESYMETVMTSLGTTTGVFINVMTPDVFDEEFISSNGESESPAMQATPGDLYYNDKVKVTEEIILDEYLTIINNWEGKYMNAFRVGVLSLFQQLKSKKKAVETVFVMVDEKDDDDVIDMKAAIDEIAATLKVSISNVIFIHKYSEASTAGLFTMSTEPDDDEVVEKKKKKKDKKDKKKKKKNK